MQASKAYFTTKTASGTRFCDREAERAQLKKNIQKGEHTVVVAPRRYGKTSLVCQSLHELNIQFTRIDLFCAVYAESICEKIAIGVSSLVKELLPFSTKALKFLEDCFKRVGISLKAGSVELQVTANHKNAHSYPEQIVDLLSGLEKLAKHKKQRVVVFIDEFQDLLKADQSDEIQAAIRNVAQHCEYVSFVFSGSSRNMLRKIFEDRNQPLYMLCQKIHLHKIPQDDLMLHLQKQGKKRWKKTLPQNIIDKILQQTECHPYYVNLLCDKLWDLDSPPTFDDVAATWLICLEEQKHKLIADLEQLSANRLKILSTLACQNGTSAPNGKVFLDATQLALGTVQKGLKHLLDNDYLHQDNGKTSCVDPLLKCFLQQYSR